MHRAQMTGTRTRLEGSGKREAVGSKFGTSHELPKAMESLRLEVVGGERGDKAVESDRVLVGRLREAKRVAGSEEVVKEIHDDEGVLARTENITRGRRARPVGSRAKSRIPSVKPERLRSTVEI
ncbi:uncharacterized protein A4U43_C03F19200 [Asparagus officinalis]|uniref:Uncharacterized protein n=1 Tax=Asparagus officinalis TaxID=4686 RepID=A0A5P1FFL9_ASPOF|nr:uncharacterized protein A4U43_C03F19200 [Asparagus officinalis]